MNKARQLEILQELLWGIISLIVTAIILLPIFDVIRQEYLLKNALHIILFILFFRYTIYAKNISYFRPKISILIFTAFTIGYVMYMYFGLQEFLYEMDNHVLGFFINTGSSDMTGDEQTNRFAYFKSEYLFFAIGSIILGLTFMVSLLRTLWKTLRK